MNYKEFKGKYQKVEVAEYPNTVTKQPLVSVSIQTYQHASYIRECLDSILAQEVDFPFEILLGEDGSTDGTKEICIEYAKKYPDKIRLFLHVIENNISLLGSRSGRFNFIYPIYESNGRYLAMCEGDDYWTDPLKLQKQVDFMEKNEEYSLCVHASKKVTVNKVEIGEIRPYKENIDARVMDVILSSGNFFSTSSYLLRKNILSGRIPEFVFLSPVGDYAFNLLSVTKGRVYFIDEYMSNYRVGVPGSALFRAKRADVGIKFAKVDLRIKMLHSFNEYSDFQFDKLVKQKIGQLEFNKLVLKRELKEIRKHEAYNELGLKEKIKLCIKCCLPEKILASK